MTSYNTVKPLGQILGSPLMYHEITTAIFFQHHSITTGIPTSVAHTVETWGHGARNPQWLCLARLGPWHAYWHTIFTSSLTSVCSIFYTRTRFTYVQFRGCQGVPGRLRPKEIVRLVEMRSVPSTVVDSHTSLQTSGYVHSSTLRDALLHATYARLDLAAFDPAVLQPFKFMTKFCLSDVD
ncbi:hypothetical protein LX36DRAFT_370556 [Colletotrichum falcatum]|nr:hypothetical protein LX36DRAFT_370556 [Colletotrichum falcatum]